MKEDVHPRTIQLVEQGRVDALSVVTHRFPLERVEDAFVQASSRVGLKVAVTKPVRATSRIVGAALPIRKAAVTTSEGRPQAAFRRSSCRETDEKGSI
jgi:hypothetical protein